MADGSAAHSKSRSAAEDGDSRCAPGRTTRAPPMPGWPPCAVRRHRLSRPAADQSPWPMPSRTASIRSKSCCEGGTLQRGQALLAQHDACIVGGARPGGAMACRDAGVGATGRLAECGHWRRGSGSVAWRRQAAVAGSKKQSARMPTCSVRAVAASKVRSRRDRRSCRATGPVPPRQHRAPSNCAAARVPEARPQPCARRIGRMSSSWPRRRSASTSSGIPIGWHQHTFERSDGSMLVLDHASDRSEGTIGDMPGDGAAELSRRNAPRRTGRAGGTMGVPACRTGH